MRRNPSNPIVLFFISTIIFFILIPSLNFDFFFVSFFLVVLISLNYLNYKDYISKKPLSEDYKHYQKTKTPIGYASNRDISSKNIIQDFVCSYCSAVGIKSDIYCGVCGGKLEKI